MNKNMFLKEINTKLKDFDNSERNEIIEYYEELINDLVDSGKSEEVAVAGLGDIDKIVNTLKAETVIKRSETNKSNLFKNFIIILSICTSPILIPIGITFFVVFLVLGIVLLALFLSFGITSVALLASSVITSIQMLIQGTDTGAIFILLGVSLFAASIFAYLTYAIYKVGLRVLNVTNKNFSKLIKRKSKIEVTSNV